MRSAEFDRDGCLRFDATQSSLAWARAARSAAITVSQHPATQAANLRHGRTWFVGVDALPTSRTGEIGGVELNGPWDAYLPSTKPLHPAQLSIIYPGYPQRDATQSDANHRYRVERFAAHMDGLLPTPGQRRAASEFHAYVLGIGLGGCTAAPTMYWPGSHHILGYAMREAIGDGDPQDFDVTEAYHAARKEVFAKIAPVALPCAFGASFLLHRFTLHGTAPWGDAPSVEEGRMIAFFRPEFTDTTDWLTRP